MDKRFAIFDMDGTLVDSMVYWKRLGREFLALKGFTEDVDSVLERVKPMTMSESSALFIREFGIPGTPESVAAEMNGMMDRHYREDIPLKPGVASYLEALAARGVTLCVASATAEPLIRACLTRLGVARYFRFMLSCEAVGSGKDHPDVYVEAARRLGAAAGEIAVYEDALYAAKTAKGAGFYTVGIWDDSGRRHWDRLAALADETITDWNLAAQSL